MVNYSKKMRKIETKSSSLQRINPHAAGIDIGASSIFVCAELENSRQEVREFLTFTADIRKAAVWLKRCGTKTIAMESTGSYWIPVFDIFEEEGFDVCLVNAHHLKAIPGKKTDVRDCQWIQTLHSYGLLRGSFRPDGNGITFRAYVRHRSKLIELSSMQILLMNKAMIQMNIRLDQAFSEISCVSSMAIIRSIVDGERNPIILAKHRNVNCKKTEKEIIKALEGNFRPEHIFSLGQALHLHDVLQSLISQCDAKIQEILENWQASEQRDLHQKPLENLKNTCETDKDKIVHKSKKKSSGKNSYKFDAATALKNFLKVDLIAIPGIDASTAIKIISEIGTDMSRWPTVKHFISWLSLCPGNKISGGKVLSSRTTQTKNKARTALKMAANSLYRSKSAIGAYFRRMRVRLGAPAAIVAAAHKLAKIIYQMLKELKEFQDIGQDAYEQQFKKRRLVNLRKQAADMGFDLQPMAV